MAPTDSELIVKAQQGDMSAFEQLVHRHDKKVVAIAATYVNCAEDAKDIYQEVFLRVYKSLAKFEMRSEFATWLYRITTNVCLTHRSRNRQRMSSSLSSGEEDDEHHGAKSVLVDESTPESHALAAEIAMHVEDAMNALSPNQRLVFMLKHFQGYKLKEIASMMECAEGTVKRYLFTATRRMRKQLKGVL